MTPKWLTYPESHSHDHHEIDDDDRDVSCIADVLREILILGVRRGGHRAQGASVHGGGSYEISLLVSRSL